MNHPERLGRYSITGVLGEGAMGVVYKAFDPVIKRALAIKTIRRQLDDGDASVDSYAARFRNEAEAAGRLQHPGIVAVYEYGEDDARAYITMEFVEGTSLAQLIAKKTVFSVAEVVDIVAQLLEALHHAHEQGVWHRDIKPANLILTPAGRVKIADFGIARIESAALTQVSSTIGTPGHMAPEQYLGDALDRRVDIFAAGVLLYQLLTGRMPFTGSSESVMYKVLNESPVPPSVAASVAALAVFDALVAQALAKAPDERFSTAAAFRRALLDIGAGMADSDQTIIVASRPAAYPAQAGLARSAAPVHDASAPDATLATAATTAAATLVATGWDASELKRIEIALATHVGPLARVMVQRAARECRNAAELTTRLAEQLPTADERGAFLAMAGAVSGAAPSGTARNVAAATPDVSGAASGLLSEPVVEQALKILTHRIGPIAKVLVKKAAQQGGSRAQFFARLAARVEQADERAQLLAELERIA